MKKIFISFLMSMLLLAHQPSRAQEARAAVTPVHLNDAQWKAVEGVFQSADNKERYVQFSAKEDLLVAKLLWNGAVLHLVPESELAFTSKEAEDEGPIHIVFHKNAAGVADELEVPKSGIWKRANDYKPVEKKEMPHTPDQLRKFEGLYQFDRDETKYIQFTEKDNKLVLKQHWDGNEIPFLPESELTFFSRQIPDFSLDFTKDQEGGITRVLAFRHDVWIKTKKPAFSPSQLKSYEGTYRSKDDPDNQVQIRSASNDLIIRQLWDGKEIAVSPRTDSYFYNETQSYPVQFLKDKDGRINRVQVLGTNIFEKLPDPHNTSAPRK